MKIGNKKMLLATGVTLLCAVFGLVLLFGGNTQDNTKAANTEGIKQEIAKNRRGVKKQRVRGKQRETARSLKSEPREKPNLVMLEDVEERELTELARKVLASLQAALDAEDYEQIAHIFSMAQNAPKGSLGKTTEGMPVALRKKLIEAMGWFGAKALPELAAFLADPDQDVFQMATDQFEMALSDITLGDRQRAEIVIMASMVLTDHDAMGRVLMEISSFRNSVAAETIKAICENGTDTAKAQMPEVIEFVTGEDNIQTVEDVDKWLENNPDGPDDDDVFGPMSDGSDE